MSPRLRIIAFRILMSSATPIMHVQDLLPAYALGILDAEETARVAEHLASCATCRAELASYEEVVDTLPLAAREVAPPPHLKQRIMQAAMAGQAVTSPQQTPSLGQWLRDLFAWRVPAWGVAMVAVILLLAGGNLALWQQLRQARTTVSTPMRIVALSGTETAPAATGLLIFDQEGFVGTLVVDGMPPLDHEHQYQLWLIENGRRDNGGVFSVEADGYGWLQIRGEKPLSSYQAFGITVEPAGGSPGPTGPKMLGGEL
ncbi:MAG: hypothetical protein D6775_08765 [Caldilineae bacterium]|nr:MAG: hypothetical protein D6775_08765 [Caldilineae bacterium]